MLSRHAVPRLAECDPVDDHSRLAYAEILPDEKGVTYTAFLTRAAAAFAGHGTDRIKRVITDNAKNYSLSRAFHDAPIRSTGPLARVREHSTPPHCARRPPTDQPAVTNPMA